MHILENKDVKSVDVGLRVAKHFSDEGAGDVMSVFRGTITKISKDDDGSDLFHVVYDDGDREDTTLEEVKDMIQLFDELSEEDINTKTALVEEDKKQEESSTDIKRKHDEIKQSKKKQKQEEKETKKKQKQEEKKTKKKQKEEKKQTKEKQKQDEKEAKKKHKQEETELKNKQKEEQEVKNKSYVGSRVAKNFDTDVYFGKILSYDNKYWHVRYDDGDEEDYDESDLAQYIKLYQKQQGVIQNKG